MAMTRWMQRVLRETERFTHGGRLARRRRPSAGERLPRVPSLRGGDNGAGEGQGAARAATDRSSGV